MTPCPFHPGKKEPFHSRSCDWEFHRSSQQKAVTQQSSAGKCSVFHQKDIYCLPTEQQLPSAAVTSFSKTHEEQHQWQHYQNACRGRGGRNGLCRMSSAPICQQGYWIPCLASPGCSSLPPLAVTQTLLSLDLLPSPWDLPLNYASFALPRVYLPKGSMWPVVCILV